MKETGRRGKPSTLGAHSKQIRSMSRSVSPDHGGEPSHVCGTWCSQSNTCSILTEAPGTNRIGRLHFRRPRISINVESLRTDAELPSGTRSKERLLGHDRIQINRPSHTWTIR